MSSVRSTRRAVAEHIGLCALGVIALVWLVACGDYQPAATPQPGSTAGPNSTAEEPSSMATPDWEPITREDPSGVVAGIVFREPVSLDEARSIAENLRGDAISLYRTDYAFVKPDAWTAVTGPMGSDGTTPTTAPVEPSRFAYVDAGKIRERRVAAIQAGLSPPITGWSISEGYWEHWEDQWARAQDPGVRFEALGLYVPESAVDALRADPRFRAVEIVPHRRTDSLSSDYAGELLLQSEAFPPDVLTEPDARSPNASITDAEVEALVDELKAGSADIGWAELMRGVDTVTTRKVVAVIEPVGTGFLLYAGGDPGHRMIPDVFPLDVREGEDPRYQDLPRAAFSDVDAGSTLALWGYPAQVSQHPGTKNDAETETVEGFRVVYWEWQGPPAR